MESNQKQRNTNISTECYSGSPIRWAQVADKEKETNTVIHAVHSNKGQEHGVYASDNICHSEEIVLINPWSDEPGEYKSTQPTASTTVPEVDHTAQTPSSTTSHDDGTQEGERRWTSGTMPLARERGQLTIHQNSDDKILKWNSILLHYQSKKYPDGRHSTNGMQN
jgi:hypothetical protein